MSMLVYHSFADPDRPAGSQFLGVAIVRTDDELSGPFVCHRLGCNPGGEIQFLTVPEDIAAKIPESYIGRLLSRVEVETLDQVIAAS